MDPIYSQIFVGVAITVGSTIIIGSGIIIKKKMPTMLGFYARHSAAFGALFYASCFVVTSKFMHRHIDGIADNLVTVEDVVIIASSFSFMALSSLLFLFCGFMAWITYYFRIKKMRAINISLFNDIEARLTIIESKVLGSDFSEIAKEE